MAALSREDEFEQSLAEHEELAKFGTYTDHEYAVIRTSEHGNIPNSGGFEYEFVLLVDGERVVNAGTIEMQGWSKPWVPALERYAKAFIDGLHE